MKRSKLPDNIFGIPEERKYPMPDKKHTLSAIKLFGHVEDKYEKELANNIIKNMKKFNISNDVVGDDTRLKKYLNESLSVDDSDKFIVDEACKGGRAPKKYKYYHISKAKDLKSLTPRVPDNFMTKNGYEDGKTARVCFATSIDGCLKGLSKNCAGEEYFVYVPDGNYKIYKPSKKEVPDVEITGEVWIKETVELKCIGKIKVIEDAGKDGEPYTYGEYTAELYEWNYKWIESLNEISLEEGVTSTVEKDHVQKGKLNLSSFRRVQITDSIINKYEKEYPFLKQVRCKDTDYYVCDGYIWFDKDILVAMVGSCEYLDDNTKWIVSLEITNNYKGYGLSKQLLDYATKNMKCKYLSVYKKNGLAVSIYKKYGFKIYEESDTMYYMTIDKNVKTESYIEEGYRTQLTMSIPVKKYNKSKGISINGIPDLVYYHKNPGLEHLVSITSKVEDLSYIRRDTIRIIPTLEKIKTRIPLCKHGETPKNKSYYKGIKKNYLDRNLTEKDVELTIKWVRDICNTISEKIRKLKKSINEFSVGVGPVVGINDPNSVYIVNYMQNNVFTGTSQERFGICNYGMKNLHTFGGKYNKNHYTHLEDFEKEASDIKVYKYTGTPKNHMSNIIEDAENDLDYFSMLTGYPIDKRSDIKKDGNFVEETYINDELSAIKECVYATAMADNINESGILDNINYLISPIIPMVNINEDGRVYNYYRDIEGVFVKNEITGLRSKSYDSEQDIRECVINLVKKGILY